MVVPRTSQKHRFFFVNFLRNLSIDLKVQILRLDVSTNFFLNIEAKVSEMSSLVNSFNTG